MTLRIWQLDPANLTPYYNLAICDALASLNHEIHYVTSRYLYDPNLPISDQYTVGYMYFKGLNSRWLLQSSRLRKLLRGVSYPFNHVYTLEKIRQQKPDVVHIQWSRLPVFDYYFIRMIKSLGIPVVHTVHNIRSSFASERMVQQLGNVYALVDKLILHTESNRREFLTLYPYIPIEKTAVVQHIVFPYPYPIPSINLNELKASFKFQPNDFVVLFFGIIRQYKGLDTLLTAFEHIVQHAPHVKLLIAGRPEDKRDLQDIERARRIQNVTIHDWFIPSEDLWKYFHIANITVFPYRAATQSGALIQAMQFGSPVVVTNVGGLPEAIDGNGWVVEKDDPIALQHALLDAIQDSSSLSQKGERSLKLMKKYNGSVAVAEKLTAIYQSCVSTDRST